jgi:lysophospholipase L1-like esterase
MVRIEMAPKRKKILAVGAVILITAIALTVVFSQSQQNKDNSSNSLARVACLGDSITNMTGYPADLQTLLGNESVVQNFGYNGASVNFESSASYYLSDQYFNAQSFQPTTVIIMLGTNDARNNLYPQINNFVGDYEHMLTRIQAFPSKPQIYIVLPPPIFSNSLDLNATTFNQQIIPGIQQVAGSLSLSIIDVYSPLINHPEYFSDGVHPDTQGAEIIANTIYQAITSNSK